MQTATIKMCYFNVLCGLKVLYWRKDNKADIKHLFMLVCIRMVFHICFATMTNFKIHITWSTKRIIFPFNLLSLSMETLDTQVGWKVAKYFFLFGLGRFSGEKEISRFDGVSMFAHQI